MQSIAIIDYGMGNIYSVQKALNHVSSNNKIFVTNNIDVISSADRIVFPGQGAMGACMAALDQYGLVEVVKKAATEKPFLGLCLGLQLLFEYSEENGGTDGLSIIPGEVVMFKNNQLNIPHMGWNTVKQTLDHPIWHNIEDNSHFYSVHSYYVLENTVKITSGKSNYGVNFTCAIAQDNIFAVQFHPEKSQKDGLQLLANFVNWNYQ